MRGAPGCGRRVLLGALAASPSCWVALLWTVATLVIVTRGALAPIPAAELPPKTRFVVAALLPDASEWHALEWPLAGLAPVVPQGATVFPVPAGAFAVAGPPDARLRSGRGDDGVVTISSGIVTRESHRSRVGDGSVAAIAFQSRPTLVAWLLAGLLAALAAGVVTELLPPSRTHGATPRGWRSFVVPLQWEVGLYGTRGAVRQALAAGDWLRRGNPALPKGMLPAAATGAVRLQSLARRYSLPATICGSRLLAGAAGLLWLSTLVVPATAIPVTTLLLLAGACAIGSAGLRFAGRHARLPDGQPWTARPERLVVNVWPDRWGRRAWHAGVAVLPPALVWCVTGLLELAVGTLDTRWVGLGTAVAGLVAAMGCGGLLWANRRSRSRSADSCSAIGAAVAARLNRIVPVDEAHRSRPPLTPTITEWGIVATIIGILASLASASHTSYIHQADVADVLRAAQVVTTPLAEHHARTGEWPSDWQALDPPLVAPVALVRGVRAIPAPNGGVELRFPADYRLTDLRDAVLPLVPVADPGGDWVWTACRGLGLALAYRPRQCRR